MKDNQFMLIKDLSESDVLDESLYCYDSFVFSLTPEIHSRVSESLMRKINQFVDSLPAIQKSMDDMKSKTEYVPRFDLIPEEIKEALKCGQAELIPCKGSDNAFYLQLRAKVEGLVINGKPHGMNRKIKDIPMGIETVPSDVIGAMQCLSMQKQLNQISDGLKEISQACEYNFARIIQGQRDDRLAKLLSSRSCFIHAIAISDEALKRQMLIQSVIDANSARAELAFQIKSDISLLGGDKSLKSKEMEKIVNDIDIAMIAMNNAVQISLYAYQVLGERSAQLAVVKEHETFIKQVLLKGIEIKGKTHLAWSLICSSGKSGLNNQDLEMLPISLLDSCTDFIESKNEHTANYLEEKSYDEEKSYEEENEQSLQN